MNYKSKRNARRKKMLRGVELRRFKRFFRALRRVAAAAKACGQR